jgi:hypothetical protein
VARDAGLRRRRWVRPSSPTRPDVDVHHPLRLKRLHGGLAGNVQADALISPIGHVRRSRPARRTLQRRLSTHISSSEVMNWASSTPMGEIAWRCPARRVFARQTAQALAQLRRRGPVGQGRRHLEEGNGGSQSRPRQHRHRRAILPRRHPRRCHPLPYTIVRGDARQRSGVSSGGRGGFFRLLIIIMRRRRRAPGNARRRGGVTVQTPDPWRRPSPRETPRMVAVAAAGGVPLHGHPR